jgi:GTP-binding protein
MIDYARITVKAGAGGAGKIAWRQDKFVRKGGPDGGNGGDGGSVWLEADKNLNTLKSFQYQKNFTAVSGQPGGKNRRSGKAGVDLIIKVPVGTVVKIPDASGRVLEVVDLAVPEQKILAAQGGRGGRGNWAFRSSADTTPKTAEPGEPGETKTLVLELKLLADIGLIGRPNVGKSTLLAALTRARPKIASYPFTTLEPNLGVMTGSNLVIADIPGLIEGASQGKGLGIEFLRHVERCKLLVHVIDATGETIPADYAKIRNELSRYSKKLLGKPEIVVLNKIDLLPEKKIPRFKKAIAVSAATHQNLNRFKRALVSSTRGLKAAAAVSPE